MTQEKLCAFGCGNPVHENRRLCKKHLEHQRKVMANYRAERKEKGLCSRCSNPARILPDGSASTLCEDCRTHVRELERAIRERNAQKTKPKKSKTKK